ncbi:hypothetical protein AWL63_19115 [Sphingomonas panacis]|uniref:Uncharacterized protein n=1 Tax=Sphingomonas panacis TaxID=1560345 RepID=A0A1B3ZE88_9SPHN|nr:hypothetical protein [Sphingomonas panacis]AOH85741.1 hypothetical protein AWL63_19115 [Sphingomonas panacis]
MNSYFVRIQLNAINGVSADRHTYDRLHAAMARIGASRTITGYDRGFAETYDLPHAEYTMESKLDVQRLRDAIAGGVSTQWADNEILVIEWAKCAWKLSKHVPALPSRTGTQSVLGFYN